MNAPHGGATSDVLAEITRWWGQVVEHWGGTEARVLVDETDGWVLGPDADRAGVDKWWRTHFDAGHVIDAADDWDQLAAGVKAGAPPTGDAADREIAEWQALVDRIAADRREQRRRRNPTSGHD